MERIVFLNGSFVALHEARVPVMDRGFLFADGVYEVSAVLRGALVDNEAHLARLDRSLTEIGVNNPYSPEQWSRLQEELVHRNALQEGTVYIQVTRGVAERNFVPRADLIPTVVMFTQAMQIVASPVAAKGAAVITLPDTRWARRDIKTIGLLAQVLAKQKAAEVSAAEAFLVEDGFVTEGGSSTVFMITKANVIVTRPLSNAILPGITRMAILRLAKDNGLTLESRPFTVQEACGAAEVFYTSASTFVTPVISIDGRPIGSARPGPLAQKLRNIYIEMAQTVANSTGA